MKYIRYGFLAITKNVVFTVVMVLEIAALFLTTNIVAATINYKGIFKKPFDDIMSHKGYYCAFELMWDTTEEYNEFYGLFDKFKSARIIEVNVSGGVSVIDDEIFFKYDMPLKSGSWPKSVSDEQGRPLAVVSPDYLKEPGDIINIDGIGETVVSGVLTDVTYLPSFNFNPEDAESFYQAVDYEKTLEDIENGNVNDFTYSHRSVIIAGSSAPNDDKGLSCFVVYDDDISDEDIKYNEAVMEEIKNYKKDDYMYILQPEFKELSAINEKSNASVAEAYYKMLPIIFVAAAVVLMGLIGTVAINTVTQLKNYGIYYLCGSRWSDCLKISFANISIILLFSGGLSALLLYMLQSFNLDYLIGQTYGWNNLIISLAMLVGMIALSLIIPFGIIRFTSPVEVVKSEK